MDTQLTILVVDDESTIREVVHKYLAREHYRVLEAASGKQAIDVLSSEKIDLIVLDVMLPELDGYTIARTLRDASPYGSLAQNAAVPIIMLTARNEEEDRLTGFEAGSDDYVIKPFSPRELVMRVKAVLKRASSETTTQVKQPLTIDKMLIDPNARYLKINDEVVSLTTKEFELLLFLAQNPNRVFSRKQLLDNIWGYEFYGDESTVTVHICRLREKIEDNPDKPTYIQTVWGAGYKFEV